MTVTERRLERSNLYTAQAAWKARNPEKLLAHRAVQHALRSGRLVRLPCADCGSPHSEAHHHLGYALEHRLTVQWLCRVHHKRRHRRRITQGPGSAKLANRRQSDTGAQATDHKPVEKRFCRARNPKRNPHDVERTDEQTPG